MSSYSHMFKFYDTIKYGSRIANNNKLLSFIFYNKMEVFMFCYNKEFAEAQEEGHTDDKEADAINSTHFKLFLQCDIWGYFLFGALLC